MRRDLERTHDGREGSAGTHGTICRHGRFYRWTAPNGRKDCALLGHVEPVGRSKQAPRRCPPVPGPCPLWCHAATARSCWAESGHATSHGSLARTRQRTMAFQRIFLRDRSHSAATFRVYGNCTCEGSEACEHLGAIYTTHFCAAIEYAFDLNLCTLPQIAGAPDLRSSVSLPILGGILEESPVLRRPCCSSNSIGTARGPMNTLYATCLSMIRHGSAIRHTQQECNIFADECTRDTNPAIYDPTVLDGTEVPSCELD